MPLKIDGNAFRIWMYCLLYVLPSSKNEGNTIKISMQIYTEGTTFRFWMQLHTEGSKFKFCMQYLQSYLIVRITRDNIISLNIHFLIQSSIAQLAKASVSASILWRLQVRIPIKVSPYFIGFLLQFFTSIIEGFAYIFWRHFG